MSGKCYFMIERRVRKQKLLAIIKEHPDLEIGKIKGIFSQQTGLSFRKIDQYISELEESGIIESNAEGKFTVL